MYSTNWFQWLVECYHWLSSHIFYIFYSAGELQRNPQDDATQYLISTLESEREFVVRSVKEDESMINLPSETNSIVLKDPTKSEAFRNKGNSLFNKKGHDNDTHARILSDYSMSIAFAPNHSEELALGYGNRSVFLLHLNRYDESILDIDRALTCTKSKHLKIKLLCRKVQCLKALGKDEDSKSLEKARKLLEELDDGDSMKKSLAELMLKAEILDMSEKSIRIDVKDKTKSETLSERLLAIKESESPMKSVAIDYDEKYGRKLIATRDFKPGDIIMIQKLYATILLPAKYYTNCYYCFETAWSGIPCDHCNWAMFCSQDCKEKAWAEYHDIECQIVPLVDMFEVTGYFKTFFPFAHLSIRLLIMAEREIGSLKDLRTFLKSVDENEDPRLQGFFQNGKFSSNTFKSIYSLKSSMTNKRVLEMFTILACRCLLAIAKFTSFLGGTKEVQQVQDLLNNDTAIFVGSLILKLMKIIKFNQYVYEGTDYAAHKPTDLHDDFDSQIGTCIAPLSSLINHSCYSNVRRFFVRGPRIVILCSLPIKKNDQIFDVYYLSFYDDFIWERLPFFKDYEFVCDCRACRENWPPILSMAEEIGMCGATSPMKKSCYKLCQGINTSLEKLNFQFNHKNVKFLSKYITRASEERLPCVITCLAIRTLREMFRDFYSFRRESFGSCE